MKKKHLTFLVLAIIGCSSVMMTPSAQSGSMPKDGELAFPTDYKSFLAFFTWSPKTRCRSRPLREPGWSQTTTWAGLPKRQYSGDGNLQCQEKCRRDI
jgi:hypothetical protein